MLSLEERLQQIKLSDDPQRCQTEMAVFENVRDAGCHLMGILPTADEPEMQPFIYSIGLLQNYGFPEVLCIGLGQVAARLINTIRDQLRAGKRPDLGVPLDDILGSHYTAYLEPITDIRTNLSHYMCWLPWFYHEIPVAQIPTVQLIWPDQHHKFPWDPDCAPGVKIAQMQLTARH